jgi:predicted nuclease of predicted toxin-antitoxin system
MIRVLLDQNIPGLVEQWLRQEVGSSAEITSTRTLGLERMKDDEIFLYCQHHAMVVLTYDNDFQNPLVIKDIPGYGVVRLNVYPTGFHQTQHALERLLA